MTVVHSETPGPLHVRGANFITVSPSERRRLGVLTGRVTVTLADSHVVRRVFRDRYKDGKRSLR